jgi:hypothetical protein
MIIHLFWFSRCCDREIGVMWRRQPVREATLDNALSFVAQADRVVGSLLELIFLFAHLMPRFAGATQSQQSCLSVAFSLRPTPGWSQRDQYRIAFCFV